MDNRQHPPRRLDFSGVVPSGILQTIVIDIVFPYMLYQLLVSHVSLLTAFAIAAIIPLANIIRTAFALRSFDLIGIIALYVIIWIFINTMVQSELPFVTILLTYVLPIGILGLATLLSRLLAKPVFFYVDHYYRIQASEAPAVSNGYWQTKKAYRQALYRLNLVWGSGQLLLAVVVILLFALISAEISGICTLVVICLFYILLTMWSISYIDGQAQNWNEADMNDAHTTSSLSPRQDF
jgi:hypothetical protein